MSLLGRIIIDIIIFLIVVALGCIIVVYCVDDDSPTELNLHHGYRTKYRRAK